MITMATRKCDECNTRKADPTTPEGRLCVPCYDYAGWENTHDDNVHDDPMFSPDEERASCPVCHPELDPRAIRSSHTNTRTHTWNSHADHHHARTPEDRARCRKLIKTTGKPYDARKKK